MRASARRSAARRRSRTRTASPTTSRHRRGSQGPALAAGSIRATVGRRQMGKTALVTGASSGLGLELARLFAARRARSGRGRAPPRAPGGARDPAGRRARRRGPRHRRGPRRSGRAAADLRGAEGAPRSRSSSWSTAPASAPTARSRRSDLGRELAMVQVNATVAHAPHRTCSCPAMIARRSGRILNLGSTAGFQPGPGMAIYYATKAFVNSFTEALAYELRGTGVTATVSCPGATATEFGKVAGTEESRLFHLGATSRRLRRRARLPRDDGRQGDVAARLARQAGAADAALRIARHGPRRHRAAQSGRTPRREGAQRPKLIWKLSVDLAARAREAQVAQHVHHAASRRRCRRAASTSGSRVSVTCPRSSTVILKDTRPLPSPFGFACLEAGAQLALRAAHDLLAVRARQAAFDLHAPPPPPPAGAPAAFFACRAARVARVGRRVADVVGRRP